MAVKFIDNSIQIKGVLNEKALAWLYEACGELASQTASNTRRGRTGQTAGSWTYKIDDDTLQGKVGSPLENAVWEEFGTGEYALNDDGRKGGWYYQDEYDGKWHHTYGKAPNRALHNAFITLKTPLKHRADIIFRGVGK